MRAAMRAGYETQTVMTTDPLLFDQCKSFGDVLDCTAAC